MYIIAYNSVGTSYTKYHHRLGQSFNPWQLWWFAKSNGPEVKKEPYDPKS
jgi:hypothetical protein